MTVSINITGLEPVAEAINNLAKAMGVPGGVTALVREKKAPAATDTPEGFEPAADIPFEEEKSGEGAAPQEAETGAHQESAYTLEEVRAKLAELQKAGKRAEVKTLLGSFGATKLSEVPAERYTALMVKAGEL